MEGQSLKTSQMVYEIPNSDLKSIKTSLEMVCGKWEWQSLVILHLRCMSMVTTNYRMNYSLDTQRKHCNLCLCNSLDTMDHLLQCQRAILLKETVTKFRFGIFLTLPLRRNHVNRNSVVTCAPRLGNPFLL